MLNQLKEVWASLTARQKKILSAYFVLGLPWIPMTIFTSFIAKSQGTKFWPDTVEARKQDVIMMLSMAVAMSSFVMIILLLLWALK